MTGTGGAGVDGHVGVKFGSVIRRGSGSVESRGVFSERVTPEVRTQSTRPRTLQFSRSEDEGFLLGLHLFGQ